MTMNWSSTNVADFDHAAKIADRALAIWHRVGFGFKAPTKLSLEMDVLACHLNGCPLKLADLATASDRDLSHDVFGIHCAINRETGKLTEGPGFLPRYAA